MQRENPNWGGSVAATMRFINDYGKRAPAAEAEGMYARLLWHVACCMPEVQDDPALDWDAARRAIDRIVRDYPVQRNIQRYFVTACRHADKAEARKLGALLQEPMMLEAVSPGNGGNYRPCRDWASGKIPQFEMHDRPPGGVKLIH
jgi:hypothetical protein